MLHKVHSLLRCIPTWSLVAETVQLDKAVQCNGKGYDGILGKVITFCKIVKCFYFVGSPNNKYFSFNQYILLFYVDVISIVLTAIILR